MDAKLRFSSEVNERVFWTLGNSPTQQMMNLGTQKLDELLRLQILLSETVIGSASYIFESGPTRNVLLQTPSFLRSGAVKLYVAHDIEDFREHGRLKSRKSPAGLAAYFGEIDKVAAVFDSMAEPLHRPPADISQTIVQDWRKDIFCSTPGSLGEVVAWIGATAGDEEEWRDFLYRLPDGRTTDFVWEFVLPQLRMKDFPDWAARKIRQRLAEIYSNAAARPVDALPDRMNISPHFASSSRDPILLEAVFRSVGVYQDFCALDIEGISALRSHPAWIFFRSVYEDLVDQHFASAKQIVALVSGADSLRTGRRSEMFQDAREFKRAMNAMMNSILGIRVDYEEVGIVDKFWICGEALGGELIRPLVLAVSNPEWRTVPVKSGLQSFIVHGHDEELLLQTKDYLQNILRWPEPFVLKAAPSRGRTIIEKFEQESDTDVIFVLFSPDDEMLSGTTRARQNVVFELGYFVGRLGRLSGRVLCLRKGSPEIPTDLSGVVYIDVSNGVAAAGEDIRREVEHLSPRTD